MIKRTLFIENKASIHTRNLQLLIKTDEREASVPIEDIGFLVIDHAEVYLSMTAMNLLVENNSAVIICGRDHLPNGMFLNLNSHHLQQKIFKCQMDASLPLKKNLWQQTVVEKIQNQGTLLMKMTGETNNLHSLAKRVTSGDTSNMEGVAASQYWKAIPWFGTGEQGIRRDRFGAFPNNLLNYGYALLRAATARALAGSGLLNTIGIHHKNQYNAFALADDIMEPFRPLVDELVFGLMDKYYDAEDLNTEMKRELLQVLTATVYFKEEKSPLMVGLQKTASSLQLCFSGERKLIKYPQLWNLTPTV